MLQRKKLRQASEQAVELMGLEPTTSCMPCKRSSQLSYSPAKRELYQPSKG